MKASLRYFKCLITSGVLEHIRYIRKVRLYGMLYDIYSAKNYSDHLLFYR